MIDQPGPPYVTPGPGMLVEPLALRAGIGTRLKLARSARARMILAAVTIGRERSSEERSPRASMLPMPSKSELRERRLKPLADRPPGTLVVHELYLSIQGEGLRAGLSCTFVRLTACHLRCTYCDTPHAFQQGEPITLDAIVEDVRELGCSLVEITGGEPLLQPLILPLMTRLADEGYTVLLETSGACDTAHVDPRIIIILDIKTPGSGEVEANLWSNLDRLRPHDEVKFVVCDRADFEWALEIVKTHDLANRAAILVAPAYGELDPAEVAGWILETGLSLRLQLQLHKLLWGPTRRGV